MLDLFTETGAEGGFRLERLEIFNWGGFDAKVWQLQPGCRNSLITGANGSGKTTAVDALVTLLVPPRSRHFNQSSGNDRRRDRTEDSYVRGAYGTARDENSMSSRVRYHRPDRKSAVSVLLAVFSNSMMAEPTCLVQVRWYGSTSGRLETRFILARESLTIVENFADVDPRGEYLRRLKKEKKVEVFNTFKAYAKAFRLRFGMRSEKALTLFNKTVGVKDIDDLNDFIRVQMLDDVETEEEFTKLKAHYDNLLDAHRQIELAEERIALLEEVESHGKEYRNHLEDATAAEVALDASKLASASLRRKLARSEQDELMQNIRGLDARLERLSSGMEDKRNAKTEVRVALETHASMGRLRELEHRLEKNRLQADRVRSAYNEFARDAETVGLEPPKDADSFAAQQTILNDKAQDAAQDENDLDAERLAAGGRTGQARAQAEEIRAEIRSLEGRRTNIPRRNMEIRNRIVHSLGWSADRLPFAGELMCVRRGEEDWRLAAERLLRPFALSLLVSDSDSAALTDYVNRHDMKGRVVYFRVRENLQVGAAGGDNRREPDRLSDKIDVKSDSPFARWLAGHLVDRFAYLCTDNLDDFQHADSAVTSKGLVKSGGIRHEKDDRPDRYGRGRSVLGWDNSDKVLHLKNEAAAAENRRRETEAELKALEEKLKGLRLTRSALERLQNVRDFADIDWFSVEAEHKEFDKDLRKLREGDNELDSLRSSLERIEAELREMENNKEKLLDTRGRMRDREEGVRENLNTAESILDGATPDVVSEAVNLFRQALGEPPAVGSLGELNRKEPEWIDSLRSRYRDCVGSLSLVQTALSRSMGRFLRPGQDILVRFPDWNSETSQLRDEIGYLPEYEALLDRLRDEDLPVIKDRFRKYMNRRISESLVGFSTLLDAADRSIDSYIRDLNASLKELPYDRARNTYIALRKEPNTDPIIREFRTLLSGSHPDQGRLVQDDLQELEAAFGRIRELIERLDEDVSWRRKVLDVRNWSRFSAVERFRDDDGERQYYQASGSLSGGEKAKLAYTILASALAYQYGLRADPVRSFRFIVVDEIFSKVDPRNAEYAMELFKNLNLQVMVVTPLDNIRLVENHISTVHFAERGSGDLSRIHDITIDDVRRRRSEGDGG